MAAVIVHRVRRSFLIPLLLPVILGISFASAINLSDRLMDYVLQEFGLEAQQRLQNWQRLHGLAINAPIDRKLHLVNSFFNRAEFVSDQSHWGEEDYWATPVEDRKSTRLNSSHVRISYAVFCLKKKT